jgi:RNA polymerase sigma factor (sigma-70 family)
VAFFYADIKAQLRSVRTQSGFFHLSIKSSDCEIENQNRRIFYMQKFNLKVKRKNGNERTIAVYLDDTTADLLKHTGDAELLDTYLREEYKDSRRSRQEAFWNRSLDEDLESGVDYEDKHFYGDYSFDDMEDERLQAAIEQLTPRQQEILRLVYIEGRTQKEIAKILHRAESSICENIQTIYKRLKEILEKK